MTLVTGDNKEYIPRIPQQINVLSENYLRRYRTERARKDVLSSPKPPLRKKGLLLHLHPREFVKKTTRVLTLQRISKDNGVSDANGGGRYSV